MNLLAMLKKFNIQHSPFIIRIIILEKAKRPIRG